jgi:LysR family transcriptional regulator, salicylic acid-responsive activator of bsdBCD
MDIRQLKYFLTIVEEGQITSAAQKLRMAQPPLSQQLKLLENELGVKLLNRGPRQVQLTDAGKLLLNRARQILELSASTIKEIDDFKRGFNGTLKLGTVSSSGSILLTKGLSNFHKDYPGVKFEIHEGNTFHLIDLLTKGIIEVGIVRTPFKSAAFHCKYLDSEPMIAAMTKAYDWSPGKTSIPFWELNNRPLIIYRRFEFLIHEMCVENNFEPNIACKNDDARTSLLWANAGFGIAVVPKSSFHLAANQNLSYKEINNEKMKTKITAIWAKDRYLSSLAEKFIENFSGI